MTQTAAEALVESRAAIARAVKAGDHLAEQFARRQLLAWKIADALNRAVEHGLRFGPDEARDWRRLIAELANGRGDMHPTSGPTAVSRLQDAILAAEDFGDDTCDRCGAVGTTVSGSLDLTGTEASPMVLERLCVACRGES